MNNLYQPYNTVALITAVQAGLTFDKAFFKEGYECVIWHMSQVKYFNNHLAALKYYETNEANKYILKIRIFNKAEEYYFWRSAGELTGRLRTDDTNARGNVYAIDTEMMLRGVIAKQISVAHERKYFIKTRNYIANDGFGYNDSRFVEITSK